jgi:hypothetical protein
MIGCPGAPLVATVRAHDKCAHCEWPSSIIRNLVHAIITSALNICNLVSKDKIKVVAECCRTYTEWEWSTTLAHYVRPSGMCLPS